MSIGHPFLIYDLMFSYLETLSNHFTMKIIVNIEIAVAITKILQVIQTGIV